MKKYYSVILFLAAVSLMSVVGFQKNADAVDQTNQAEVLRDEKAIEHLKKTGGYDSLAAAFNAARYEIEPDGEVLAAENPANKFAARFAEDGAVQIFSAPRADSARQSVWKLKSVGRGANRAAIGAGVLQSSGSRVENRRAEIGLTEYFENRPDGLEQGFILDEKPSGDENLSLILQTSGELRAKADADGQAINLFDKSGAEVLRYEKLKVWDAENKYLTARMTTDEAGEIRLDVEDAAAVYPLTIDPTFIQTQKLTEANDGASYFGSTIDVSGDTVIIGAKTTNSSQGAAYVFVRSGKTWTRQAKLVAADASNNDNFGHSVAISGDTVIVGSPFHRINGNSNQGAAYIYVRNGVTWSGQEKIVAPGGAAGDCFGLSVSVSGETVIAGALRDDIGTTEDQGAAFAFVRSGGVWTFQQRLTAADGAAGDVFGTSVFLSGGTAIVGAPGKNTNEGAAYVFVRSGTTWNQQTKLTASDGAGGDEFGQSVTLSSTFTGTIAVVGAPYDSVAGNPNQGSAYVFTRSGTIWAQTQKLIAENGAASGYFGSSISISPITGSTILIGAPSNAISFADGAYIFRRVNSVWTQQQKLRFADGNSYSSLFGASVALIGDTAFVGAPGGLSGGGAAYVYNIGSRPFDFDGDGKSDVSVFRPNNGAWYVSRSSDAGFAAQQFGLAGDLIAPGDYDADGKTDYAVFRPSAQNWYILKSNGNIFVAQQFGTSADIPVPADYDGDGKTDLSVYRPNIGAWYLLRSSDNALVGFQFGASEDKPVPADYDADGKADYAVFRPSNGVWYRQQSSNGFAQTQFGASTDKLVPADYDADGRADLAVFRPSNGVWYVQRSTDGFFSQQFGSPTDIPAPGDFDADGKTDISVFRPDNGNWYIIKSGGGALFVTQFGANGDKPIPSFNH